MTAPTSEPDLQATSQPPGSLWVMPPRRVHGARDYCRTPNGEPFTDLLVSLDGASRLYVWVSPGLPSPEPGTEIYLEKVTAPVTAESLVWGDFDREPAGCLSATRQEMTAHDCSPTRVAAVFLDGGWAALTALVQTHRHLPLPAALQVAHAAQESPATIATRRTA